MEKWAFKYARQWDEDVEGKYAYLGMLKVIEDKFNIHYQNTATEYILETYLECYDEKDSLSFEEYLEHCRIWTEKDLETEFGDIWKECITEEGFCEYMDFFYPEETDMMWPWENGVFTTWVSKDFEKNRTEINWKGMLMECERLICMLDYEEKYGIEITKDDLDKTAEVISYYGYDIRNDYDYQDANDMLERYNQVIGGLL